MASWLHWKAVLGLFESSEVSTQFNRPAVSDMFLLVAFSTSLCLSQSQKVHFVCLSISFFSMVFESPWCCPVLLCCSAVVYVATNLWATGIQDRLGVPNSLERVSWHPMKWHQQPISLLISAISAVPPPQPASLLATQDCAIPMCLLHERRDAALAAIAISHDFSHFVNLRSHERYVSRNLASSWDQPEHASSSPTLTYPWVYD